MAYWPDTGTGVDTQPARKPVQSAIRKYFTEGGIGQPPTVPGGDWFNQMTNEVLNVLEAAGIEPSKTDDDQLLLAIKQLLKNDFSKLSEVDGFSLVGGGFYDDIRSYSGSALVVQCFGRQNMFDHSHGFFVKNVSDLSSPDDDGSILIDADGYRWYRIFSGKADLRWWGVVGDGVTSDSAALGKAIASYKLLSAWPDARILLTKTFNDGSPAAQQYQSYAVNPVTDCTIDLAGGTIVRAPIGSGDAIDMYKREFR